MIVTIDGVAASGKSSVAGGVARALGMPYVSSGLLYRAATLLALEAGTDLGDAPALLQLLERSPLRLEPLPEGNAVFLAGPQGERDLTADAHTGEVDAGVSALAQLPELRGWVNARLRALTPPFVAEGRDMGTAVFPGASAKFFLTASPRVRALRRVKERLDDVDAVEAALIARDAKDRQQSQPAADAHRIDTSELDLPGVIAAVLAELERSGLKPPRQAVSDLS
ncbi:(d)CMP kinase [Deinococcus irradiatisoli]|uniref:Cytidylate kinase n=1 Tax=Deinococcus irradiatisoli TaxID=2202254 RepID=A0A2Z3JBJ4_9DEIO|nr:(d)CMP kinase [Deinococcus irradiatisoli]AWN22402.1 (d)CMP kinase [Deinococcus irradiatisoli]